MGWQTNKLVDLWCRCSYQHARLSLGSSTSQQQLLPSRASASMTWTIVIMPSKKLPLPTYHDAVGAEAAAVVDGAASQNSSRRKLSFKSWLWKLTFVFGTLIYGSHTIFINLSQVDGQIPFNPTSAVFMTETIKLLFCLCIYVVDLRISRKPFVTPRVQQAWPFAIPALIYAINNNLAYHIQLHMDPASFQVG